MVFPLRFTPDDTLSLDFSEQFSTGGLCFMAMPLADPRPALTFVSDVHLGGSPEPEETVKRERLFALLDRVGQEQGSLYILGDLFDFWFEYRSVIPRAAVGTIARLDALARSGSPVRFLGGNHDF